MQDETQNQNSNLDDKIEDELEDLAEHSHQLPPSQDKDTDHIPDIWEKPAEPKSPIKPLPSKEQPLDKKSVLPEKQKWAPIDFSKTSKITEGIFGSRPSFIAHQQKELNKDLGSTLNDHQRAEISKDLASARKNGLRRGEVAKKIDKWKEKGLINKFEAKKLRKNWHAKKSSSFF